MTAAAETFDLGQMRGLSPETLARFNVRQNGTGWLYDSKCSDGTTITRWKSFYSHKEDAPESERAGWQKYRWYPEKKDSARYFYPVGLRLMDEIKKASGVLWLVGGDIAGMTMIEAGILNSISCFGDHLPPSFAHDLTSWGVTSVYCVPDRDNSGQAWAMRVREALRDTDIILDVLALPYPVGEKHGKDINDFWRESDRKDFEITLSNLDTWKLPEPEPRVQSTFTSEFETRGIPESLKAEIRFRLGIEDRFNSGGWAKKNVRCPFHDDKEPSATWNDESAILYCHASCGKSYLVKDLAEFFGLRMADYFDDSSIPHAAPSKADEPAPAPAPKVQLKDAPELPQGVELTEAQRSEAAKGRRWLDSYVKWASEAANATPEIFHEAMGLWLLSTAATRRVKLQIGGLEIYPNLYIMIVARTSVYCKSTGMSKAASVLTKANLDVLKLPGEMTPEALFDELAGVKPMNFDKLPVEVQRRWLLGRAFAAQKSIMKDEASSILANLKKEYMGGLSELLLQGYDSHNGTIDKRVQSRGLVSIRDLSLCFLGATTPIMWAKYVTAEENENGLTPRFAIITPEGPPEERPAPDVVEMPHEIVAGLRRMFLEVLPGEYKTISPMDEITSPPVYSASIAPTALNQLKAYVAALRLHLPAADKVDESKTASYARLGVMAYKIAILLAAVDSSSPAIRIEERHAYAAQQICERWRDSLHRLDKLISRAQNGNVHERLLKYIENFGTAGVTLREIMRDFNFSSRAAALEKLATLADSGVIERFDRRPEGRGRPSICFRVVTD